LAASRTPVAPTAEAIAARIASRRINFATIAEPMQVPNLLALQTESFDWLRRNHRRGAGRAGAPHPLAPGFTA